MKFLLTAVLMVSSLAHAATFNCTLSERVRFEREDVTLAHRSVEMTDEGAVIELGTIMGITWSAKANAARSIMVSKSDLGRAVAHAVPEGSATLVHNWGYGLRHVLVCWIRD